VCRSILDSQKTWNFKNYSVKYRDNGFIVFDSEGKNIYCNIESLGKLNYDFVRVPNENELKENLLLIEEIDNFSNIVQDQIQKNHFSDSWPTTSMDLFFKTKKIELGDESEYQNILNNFKENDESFWTGVFSYSFIHRVRKDLGEDNVKVLNIIRNPSVCMFVNNFDENSQLKNGIISILNMMMIKNLPNVINIKYEDYLKNGKFILDDKEVFLREQLTNYNGIINEYEMYNYNPEKISNYFMNQINQNFLNFDFLKNVRMSIRLNSPNEYNLFENYMRTLEDDLNDEVVNQVPKNFFDHLGYIPLDIQQIISQ